MLHIQGGLLSAAAEADHNPVVVVVVVVAKPVAVSAIPDVSHLVRPRHDDRGIPDSIV